MTAGTFTLYDQCAELLMDGTIDLDTHTFNIALFDSGYTPSAAHTTYASISADEVANGNGYTTGGEALASVTWAETGGVGKFDSDDKVWTAVGTLTARFAVVYDTTGGYLLGYMLLDDTPADVSATDADFTVGPNASNGWFDHTVNP